MEGTSSPFQIESLEGGVDGSRFDVQRSTIGRVQETLKCIIWTCSHCSLVQDFNMAPSGWGQYCQCLSPAIRNQSQAELPQIQTEQPARNKAR
jgi:hypothetical protein